MLHSVTVEEILTRYYVRYERLDQLIPYAFEGSKSNELDLYIDLYGLYHTLYSRSYATVINDYTAFTSFLINMCAHYRSYFKYQGVYTHIYLISSFNIPDETRVNLPEYNKDMIDKLSNKQVSDMMNLNLEILDLLVPYLPNIYFVKTKYESSVAMYHLMQTRKDAVSARRKSIPSLIISTDEYPIQLCSLVDDVAFLWPRKYRGEDISVICPPRGHSQHRNDFWSVITRKNSNSVSFEKVGTLSTSNLALVEALNKFSARDLKVIYNITTTSKMIRELNGVDIELVPDIVFKAYSKIPEDRYSIIQKRYNALSIPYQYIFYSESTEPKILKLDNLEDPDAIHMINDQYFRDNPIDVFRL